MRISKFFHKTHQLVDLFAWGFPFSETLTEKFLQISLKFK